MRSYEQACSDTFLRRTPVVVRVDGCDFRERTKSLDKPIDRRIQKSMDEAAKVVIDSFPHCVATLQYSDEVSFIFNDTASLEVTGTQRYHKQYLVSRVVSIFTNEFDDCIHRYLPDSDKFSFVGKGFNVPYNDIAGYVAWRQGLCEISILRSCAANIGGAKFAYGQYEEILEYVNQFGVDFQSWPLGDRFGHFWLRDNGNIVFRDDLLVIKDVENTEYIRGLFKDIPVAESSTE